MSLSDHFSRSSAFTRSLISAVAGFLFYGGWAYLVNSMHGSLIALKAACVQGSYSFMLTFFMTFLIEAIYRFATMTLVGQRYVRLITIVVSCGIIFSASWMINVLAGTPEILHTVLPGYIVGGVYTYAYVRALSKTNFKTDRIAVEPSGSSI